MKIIFTFLIMIVACSCLAQKMQLRNDVVYKDNKPVAIFKKKIHSNNEATSIEVFTTDNKLLIQLVAKKMKAPVRELSSFYYHDIIFPGTGDSLALYNPDEAPSLFLFSLIEQYDLIKNDRIDSSAVAALVKGYSQKRFDDKMNEMMTYLDDTRNYYRQVERDRTKPVYIINEKNIMQDSMLVGRIIFTDIPQPDNYYRNSSLLQQTKDITNPPQNIEIYLTTGDVVDKRFYRDYYQGLGQRLLTGEALYKLSRPRTMSDNAEYARLLALACCLIENYAL